MTHLRAQIATAWLALLLGAAPAEARDWTPHTAAALLDASFPTAEACRKALGDARRRESRAGPVDGLSYTHLFEQGRCHDFVRDGSVGWRIRMHWQAREGLPPSKAPR